MTPTKELQLPSGVANRRDYSINTMTYYKCDKLRELNAGDILSESYCFSCWFKTLHHKEYLDNKTLTWLIKYLKDGGEDWYSIFDTVQQTFPNTCPAKDVTIEKDKIVIIR